MAKSAAELVLPGGHGMFEELIQSIARFRSVVVERSHVTVPRDAFDVKADGPGESVEPIVLSEGALSANHASYRVETGDRRGPRSPPMIWVESKSCSIIDGHTIRRYWFVMGPFASLP